MLTFLKWMVYTDQTNHPFCRSLATVLIRGEPYLYPLLYLSRYYNLFELNKKTMYYYYAFHIFCDQSHFRLVMPFPKHVKYSFDLNFF